MLNSFGLRHPLSRFGRSRRLLKALDRIAIEQSAQTLLLKRLADVFAPAIPEVSEDDIRTAGPLASPFRDREQRLIQDFEDQMRKDLGREPTEEEIAEHLDEIGERPGGIH